MEDKMEFRFKLSEHEAQIMLNALAKEPYGLVIEVINKIQKQASEQMKENNV